MVYVRGKARIRHADTAEIYEIGPDQIDFAVIGSNERNMGPETVYSAVVDHPQLGQLVWDLWEYPIGADNHRDTDVGPHELLENIDFGLQHEPPDDDVRQARVDTLVKWLGEYDRNQIVKDLDDLISGIPESTSDPVFRLGDDGLVHMAAAPDRQPGIGDGDLLEELCSAATDLCDSLQGTNAHTDLLRTIENYRAALLEDLISISRLYARGVRLENAARTARRRIEADDLPDFTAETGRNLDSVLGLHAAYIMSVEDGRRLVEGAAAYRRTPDDTAALREAAEKFSSAVGQRPDVFSEEVRRHVAQVARDVGAGPHPERSNQVAVTSLGSMTGELLKWAGGAAIGAIVTGAVVTSAPGIAATAGGASAIDEIASFLASNAQLLILFAAAAGSDLSWLTPVAHLLDRLRRGGKK